MPDTLQVDYVIGRIRAYQKRIKDLDNDSKGTRGLDETEKLARRMLPRAILELYEIIYDKFPDSKAMVKKITGHDLDIYIQEIKRTSALSK